MQPNVWGLAKALAVAHPLLVGPAVDRAQASGALEGTALEHVWISEVCVQADCTPLTQIVYLCYNQLHSWAVD